MNNLAFISMLRLPLTSKNYTTAKAMENCCFTTSSWDIKNLEMERFLWHKWIIIKLINDKWCKSNNNMNKWLNNKSNDKYKMTNDYKIKSYKQTYFLNTADVSHIITSRSWGWNITLTSCTGQYSDMSRDCWRKQC